MGDKHVCSVCGADLARKQHIKIVFENWPVEETVTVRSRTGKERTVKRTQTKEVITAFGMECLENPEKWKELDAFSEGKIGPGDMANLFDDIRWVGKNPLFLLSAANFCLSGSSCAQFQPGPDGRCIHIAGLEEFKREILRWAELYCYVGHPGAYRIYNRGWQHPYRNWFKELWLSLKSWGTLLPAANIGLGKTARNLLLVPVGALAALLLYLGYAFVSVVILVKSLIRRV